MKKGRGYYCYIILPKGSGKPTKKIISNSPTPGTYITKLYAIQTWSLSPTIRSCKNLPDFLENE